MLAGSSLFAQNSTLLYCQHTAAYSTEFVFIQLFPQFYYCWDHFVLFFSALQIQHIDDTSVTIFIWIIVHFFMCCLYFRKSTHFRIIMVIFLLKTSAALIYLCYLKSLFNLLTKLTPLSSRHSTGIVLVKQLNIFVYLNIISSHKLGLGVSWWNHQ